MACLEMYNNTQSPSSPSPPPPMSPRISFSNDFVESHNSQHNNFISSRSELPPASTDFEFSGVSSFNMVSSADELFFKGRLLPFKDTNNTHMGFQRTLRDELLVNDDEPHFSLKPPRTSSSSSSIKWKGFLGLRKSNIASKKVDKIEPSFDSAKRFSFSLEDPNLPKSPQELMSSEGSSSNDMEMGI